MKRPRPEERVTNRRKKSSIPYGMPKTNIVKLKYVDNISINPAAVGLTSHYFSANGMYDPDITGIGHQPLFFDQFMASYDHYRVIGSSIKVTQTPVAGTGSDTPCLWGVIVDDNTFITYADAASLIESNQSGGKFSMGSRGLSGINSEGKNPTITQNVSVKKYFGGDLTSVHEGDKTANPADQVYYGIWAGSADNITDPTTIYLMVEISYIAILKEPHFVAQS